MTKTQSWRKSRKNVAMKLPEELKRIQRLSEQEISQGTSFTFFSHCSELKTGRTKTKATVQDFSNIMTWMKKIVLSPFFFTIIVKI